MFQTANAYAKSDREAFFKFRKKIYWQDHATAIPYQDLWDENCVVFTVKDKQRIIAGTRLIVSKVGCSIPAEKDIPDLHRRFQFSQTGRYSELSRLSIHPDYRQTDASLLLFTAIEDYCRDNDINQIVFMSNHKVSRFYAIIIQKLNRLHSSCHELEVQSPDYLGYTNIAKYTGFIDRVCLVRLQFNKIAKERENDSFVAKTVLGVASL